MDSDGSILIDRDGTYFNLILNFMRDGEVDLPDDDHALQLIKREVEFYSFEVWKVQPDDFVLGFPKLYAFDYNVK